MIRHWVDLQGETLLRPLEAHLAKSDPYRGLYIGGDRRSPEDFRAQVEAYLTGAERHLRALALRAAIEESLGRVTLELRNPTRGNWERVELQLSVPEGVDVYLDQDEPNDVLEPPRRPKPWGQHTLIDDLDPVFPIRNQPIERDTVDREADGVTVRFAPVHLRPGATKRLEPIYLFPDPERAGTDLNVGWRATSTSAVGWVDGTLVLRVEEEPATLSEPGLGEVDD